jgi:hypothetical protein
MFPTPHIPNPPPGQEKKYPESDENGSIPFRYAPTGIAGEISYWIWRDLASDKIPLMVLHG